MGTWGAGPFENDAAADFLDSLESAPARVLTRTLREAAESPAEHYLDVDVGGACWAACELVALSFGYGEMQQEDRVLDYVSKLKPNEALRALAVRVLERISDLQKSELAGLWADTHDGQPFRAALGNLRDRLEAARQGRREPPKPKKGDVIAISDGSTPNDFAVIQVIGPSEVAVLAGTFTDTSAAIDAVKTGDSCRIPARVSKLFAAGRLLGNLALRRELKEKKLYAYEVGALEDYGLAYANARSARTASYDEARECDVLRFHGREEILKLALGLAARARVRSPEAREVELSERNADLWAARRRETTPGPFGDPRQLAGLLAWIEEYGIENAVQRNYEIAIGSSGYGRPNEDAERRAYAFAGLVALWQNGWSEDAWPRHLAARRPVVPRNPLLGRALEAARVLAAQVITRDAELRLIWDRAPDGGAQLREIVASLQRALA